MEPLSNIYQQSLSVEYAPSQILWGDVTSFLKRYTIVILLVFMLTVLGTYTTLMFLTQQYETAAAVIVKIGRENVDPPPTASNTNVFSGLRREEVLSEMEFMRSPDLILRVVREIGLAAFTPQRMVPPTLLGKAKFYVKAGVRWVKEQYGEALIALNLEKRLSDEQKAVKEVSNSLEVVYQKDSDVIDLKIRMADPALSESILSRLLDLYMQRRIEVKQTSGADEFLRQRAQDLRQRLNAAEASKEQWKQSVNLSSPQEQKTLLLRQIREVMAERDATLREVNAVAQQREATSRLLTQTAEQLRSSRQETPDASTESLKQRLAVLESERAHLLSKFDPNSPQIQDASGEIARMKELIAAAQSTQTGSVTFQVNPLYQDLERKLHDASIALQGLQAKASLEAKQLIPLENQLKTVDSASARLDAIERDRSIAETEYLAVLKRQQQSDIDSQLNRNRISNVSILTPPMSSLEPVYPRSMLLMGVAIVVGLVLGIGLSFLLNYFDDRIHDPQTAEMILQVPYLGSVESDSSLPGPLAHG
jgi:uncharacterized protein involved in exopolysaccharide biosynthesis